MYQFFFQAVQNNENVNAIFITTVTLKSNSDVAFNKRIKGR